MGAVTVSPEKFSFVFFDAKVIEDVAVSLLERLAMSDHALHIEVDETTPIARISIEIGSPLVVKVESGAFEDTRRPRQMSTDAVAGSLGRVLLRARDRLDGTFGEAPGDDDLSLAQIAAWEAYCVGRLERLGYTVHQQRWRYNFRNRHGFTDAGDSTFDELWRSDRLTWSELDQMSGRALEARDAA
jgi:hypothetical protein